MNYDVKLTIGHNVNGVDELDMNLVCAAVENVLGVEAFTALPCRGMWRGEAEESTRIEMNALTDAATMNVMELLPMLADELGQEQIMFEKNPSNVVFVDRMSA